jgi:hypothetical protein
LVASGATGCVGWSESERAIACIEGRWGLGVDERSWALVVRSGATRTPISLAPGPDFPAPGAVTDDPLPAPARERAQARLTSGGFRTITNGRTIEAGATLTLGIVRASYTRAAASAGGNNSAPQFNERLEIIPDATGSAIEVFSFSDVATGDTGPVVTIYPVVGGPFVVHRSANTADEGINQIEEQVWVCDIAARRCE